MKLTTTNWQNKKIELTVEDAIGIAINDAWADGELECAKERVDNAAKVIQKIVVVLVDKGILSASDLRDILPYRIDVE
jgi:hypothetical protein